MIVGNENREYQDNILLILNNNNRLQSVMLIIAVFSLTLLIFQIKK